MADDKYDSDYWAMAQFWMQDLREAFFGLPAVPGGREFRPVSGGALSQNIEDRRDGSEPSGIRYDLAWEQHQNKALGKLMADSLLRRTSPFNPESFIGQDPLHRDMMHPMDRPGPDPLR